MRLSRTAWLILLMGVFIIAFATLYTVYSRQSSEQKELEASLSKTQASLPKLAAEREDLESQLTQWEGKLAEATSALNKARAKLVISVESIEYDETLFKIADDCGLEIIELTASEPSGKKVEGITYAVTTFEVRVRSAESPPSTAGEFETYIDETVASVLDFVDTVAKGEKFTTATIEAVTMENLEPPDEEDLEGAGEAARWEMAPEATIKLIIYSYQGE